jgi:IS5 family transposase
MLKKLTRLAHKRGVTLRQSYARVAKRTQVKSGRLFHAKKYALARREVKKLKTLLGRVVRDIERKIQGN